MEGNKQNKLSVRRSTKQVMERQRRARINTSLNQIRKLVLQGLNKDPGCFEKLEKADILELTVRYLKTVKCRPSVTSSASSTTSSTVVCEDENSRQSVCSSASSCSCSSSCSRQANSVCTKYRTGYLECLEAVQKYIELSCPSLNRDTKWRLTRHLQSRRFQSVHFQRCDCFLNEHRRVILPCALHSAGAHPCAPSPASSTYSETSLPDCVDGLACSSAGSLSPADTEMKFDGPAAPHSPDMCIWRPW